MATKAELEARVAELEQQLKQSGQAVQAPAPTDPSFVEEVVYKSEFRSPRVNFPWREQQQGRQLIGQRPPMAEFSPAGTTGLYRTQDPDEIKFLDGFCRYHPGFSELSRSMVPRDPMGGAPVLANVPEDLREQMNARKTVSPLEEGEPV